MAMREGAGSESCRERRKAIKDLDGVKTVKVDATHDAHASAVAAHLAAYSFTLKTSPPSRFNPNLKEPIPDKFTITPEQSSKEWDEGVICAEAQNFARTLMELPANMMTPTAFTERAKAAFAGLDNVEVIVRDEAWAEKKGMNSFLSVTHGTSEPAKFLEIHYKGAPSKDAQPLAFVGKGITFDTGGISLKPGANMKLMRGDMGGAATVVASTLAIAKLKLPINLVTVTPLTENMPGSIEIDNTDAEGRLVLADAIYYASTEFKPHTLIDVATLTGAIVVAIGEHYSGVSPTLRSSGTLGHSGEAEYDRFWRMPLDEAYGPQIYGSNADLMNVGGSPAGSATAALFLKHFVDGVDGDAPKVKWAHIDIAGSMEVTRPTPYMEKGMSGRPVGRLSST
ncbi:cytosol aminopeptidase family, catalytic domain-containing protein [Mucidula mucida]|nr:cytosol aminopeptidase family, catalytic domain-containing protein [Mucidula mucida]